MVNKNLFLIVSNYIKPFNEINININVVCYYKYDDPLEVSFFFKAYPLEGKLNFNFIKKASS